MAMQLTVTPRSTNQIGPSEIVANFDSMRQVSASVAGGTSASAILYRDG